jgi:hypothetical protein
VLRLARVRGAAGSRLALLQTLLDGVLFFWSGLQASFGARLGRAPFV